VVLHVAKEALLDDGDINSVQFQADPVSGRPQVGITFTEQGKKAFAEVTRTNLNKQLAIIIDGKVVSAPVIRTEIRDGKAIIDGNFTEEEAKDLAARINKTLQERGAIKPWRHGPYDQLRPTPPE
jgi:preprotein translocase subunit SecD